MSLQFRVEHFKSVTSTSDIIKQKLSLGAAPGLVVTADEQSQGRGRLGRQWSSPRGNLYCSILLPADVATAQLPSLSLVIALSLAQSIGEQAKLKWPNDVLIKNAKIAGILLELEEKNIIVGTGVNIESHPDGLPYPATHLRDCGIDLSVNELLERFLLQLDQNFNIWRSDGFVSLRPSWLARSTSVGEPIKIRQNNSVREVTFQDVTTTGNLMVQSDGGSELIAAAEILGGNFA